MKWTLFIFSLAFLLTACEENTSKESKEAAETAVETIVETMTDNMLSSEEKEAGWELLFDGSSSTNWRGYGMETMPDNWVIEEGILKVLVAEEGQSKGDIITTDKYKDFELQLDFMLTDTANSGILYLVKEVEGTPIWHNAPEYQLIDDDTYISTAGEEATKTHLSGENYDMQAASGRYLKGTGVWNTAKIVIKDKHVEHYLNGEKTIEYDLDSDAWQALVDNSKFTDYEGYGKATEGHIGLQDHDHEVHFKNIKLRKL